VGGANPTNTLINGITFDHVYMPGSNQPAANLFQMNLFEQGNYSNLVILPAPSAIAQVYLTADDPGGSSSFSAAGNWSNGQQPTPGSNYVVAAHTLRTPTSGNATFAGSSLTLYDSATLALKNDGYTTTVGSSFTNGLFLDNSIVKNVDTTNDTLAGYVTLLADGGILQMPKGPPYTFTVSAAIGGTGWLQAGTSADFGTILLSGTNSYTGGTIFGSSFDGYLTLQLAGAGTLGATNGPLTFNSTNDILDLNGTSQGVGNLAGPAGTITNSAAAASTLTIGNGGNGGGAFAGNVMQGRGAIALIKAGTGTITLAGTNTYTGGTTVSAGTLALSGSISNTAFIAVASGATLDASGRTDQTLTLNGGQSLTGGGKVNGSLVVSSGAAIEPGDMLGSNPGTLTVQSNITLRGSLWMKLNRTNAQACDQLVSAAGSINGGGTLTVTNAGPALQASDAFPLFNVAASGFSTVTLPGLTPGLGWTNKLAANGTIQVAVTAASNPTNIMVQVGTNGLTLSWPSNHTGWWLQEATNLAGTNWVGVTGSTSTNQMIFPISSTNAALFFRLLYP
jgi:autotransporter-associated beta strand protein